MPNTTVHIINHTHWDREWFLTSIYTTEWIPGLIDRLEELVAANPDFHYLLDGQTLIIEDLLGIRPDYADRIKKLVSDGNLLIGPYYCQPDWQLTCGESLVRNLRYGLDIMNQFGGRTDIGWLVDTFGHVSQAPQIHRNEGIESVYVWRGVPQLEPYFAWQGTNGDTVFAIDLFGGYRNLYGITHAPTIAEIRLEKESGRLAPYYPTADIPLFDGYDLEDNPEDPVRWLHGRNKIPAGLTVTEATPMSFAQTMRAKMTDLPHISGELNSGKFGATFPGTFSSRAYLKLMGHDCEHRLYQVVEPLNALALPYGEAWQGEKFQAWTKAILQNAVHDAICGVSIDQVHEKMEYSYRQIFGEMSAEIERLLPVVCQELAGGRYAISTALQAVDKWVKQGDQLIHIKTEGLGAWEISETRQTQATDRQTDQVTWQNDHYAVSIDAAGQLDIDGNQIGQIQVSAEHGDTYSDETGDVLGHIQPDGPLVIEQEGDGFMQVAYHGRFPLNDGYVAAQVRYTFDPSPIVGIEIELDSRGTNFHAELPLHPLQAGQIWAGMPFDRVQRQAIDRDLLPRQLEDGLQKIMMGQRELNMMRTFPMHRFVGNVTEAQSAVLFSRGSRAYRSWKTGQIAVSLRRSTEWVTEANLENRIGDAGPFFYVPDARCERTVKHQFGLYIGEAKPSENRFNELEASFSHTPLLVDVTNDGNQTLSQFQMAHQDQPVTAVWPEGDTLMGRVWHATGTQRGQIAQTDLGKIEAAENSPSAAVVSWLNPSCVRSGDNQGLPDQAVIDSLQQKAADLAEKVAETQALFEQASGSEKLKLEHQLYIYNREQHEFLLSHRLNELKLAQNGALTADYLYEPDALVTKIGYDLNQLRIKRRIFDYVATVI